MDERIVLLGSPFNSFTINFWEGLTAMKKRKVIIPYFVFLMMIATMTACSSASKHESTGEVI